MTENERLAMMKNTMPIANEGNPTRLVMCRSRQNDVMGRFYREIGTNREWHEEFNVILTADEARNLAAWLLHCASLIETAAA